MDGGTLVNSLIRTLDRSSPGLARSRPACARRRDGRPPARCARASHDCIDPPTPSRPGETLHGAVTGVDEQHDRITLRLTADFKVQDGLLFNAVRFGDQVEIIVETIDGAGTIGGLRAE